MTRAWATATATRWPRSGTSCRCSSRSTRSRSPQPTRRQPRRGRALRRGRRALPEPRAAPAARLLALPRRPRRGHRDLVRRQRLVGPRVHERLPRDRQRALPRRRRAGAALHRRRRLGSRQRAGSGGTPSHPYKAGEALASATLLAALIYQQTPLRLRARARRGASCAGRTRAASARPTGSTPAASSNPTPDRLHRGAADLRAGAALPAHRRPAANATCAERLKAHRAHALRLPARLLARSTTRSTCSGCSRCTRSTATRPCTRWPPTTRATRRRARSTANGLYLLSWNGETLPAAYAVPGMLQTQAATTSLFAWLAVYPPPCRPSAAPAPQSARAGSDAEPDHAVEDVVGQQPLGDQHRPRVAARRGSGRASARAVSARSIVSATSSGGTPRLRGVLEHLVHRRRHLAVLRLAAPAGSSARSASRAALVPDRRRDRARLDQRHLHARACAAPRAARRRSPRSRAWRPRRAR